MRRWTKAVGMLLALGLGWGLGPTLDSTLSLSLGADLGRGDSGPEAVGAKPLLRFFVVGDAPYGDAEFAPLEQLLSEAASEQPEFLAHVGDIKGGGEPCTETRNRQVAGLFARQPVPILYTPGDNEWTDCYRKAAGERDPLERLAALRARFFADPEVLHQQVLGLSVPDVQFPENRYGIRNGVMIVVMHVVGSSNNRRPRQPEAMAEWRRRSAANRMLLEQATAAANAAGARAMLILFHANPLFERSPPAPGFAPLIEDLARLLSDYEGPVLTVHGDTHRFQFNRPLERGRSPIAGADRLWRLEVPGSPFLGGVWVTVQDDPAAPFAIAVTYPRVDEAIGLSD